MGLSGIHLSSERRNGLSIYRILEQDQVVTISSLGGIFAKVHVLVQSDCRQVSVMTSLGKEIFESRILVFAAMAPSWADSFVAAF